MMMAERFHGIMTMIFVTFAERIQETVGLAVAAEESQSIFGTKRYRKMLVQLALVPERNRILTNNPMSSPLSSSKSLPPDHYIVPLTYKPLPPIDALKKAWGKDNVSDIFDGRPFTLHASCVGMDRTPSEKVFYLHDAGGDWESEEQIAWGEKQRNTAAPNGYRPATHEETYEFAKAHPELVDFVGCGSFALRGDDRRVASVWQYGSRRVLGSGGFGGGWRRGHRVLFVSKESSALEHSDTLSSGPMTLPPSDKALLAQFASAALTGTLARQDYSITEDFSQSIIRTAQSLLAEYKRVTGEE